MSSLSRIYSFFLIALGHHAIAKSICSETINAAGGSIPNTEMPLAISIDAIQSLQLVYFLQNIGSSYFAAGLKNLTTWDTEGIPSGIVESIASIAAQEQVHLASLDQTLEFYNVQPVLSCKYLFPVTSTREFLELGQIITAVGVSTMIGVNEQLAITDPLLVKQMSSTLAVKARHHTLMQGFWDGPPSPTPFDTGISQIWAYNLALHNVEPGSCSSTLPFPILPILTVSSPSSAQLPNGTSYTQLEFTWDASQIPFVAEAGKRLYVGWVNQLNKPVYTPLNITASGRGTTSVPAALNGTTYAVVTSQQQNNTKDLTLATMAGPAVLFDF